MRSQIQFDIINNNNNNNNIDEDGHGMAFPKVLYY